MSRGWVLAALIILPLPLLAEDAAPKPKDQPAPVRVRLELRNAPLVAVLKALCEKKGRTLVTREEIAERVSLSFDEMEADEAFDNLIALHGYRKDVDGTSVTVTRGVPDVAPVKTSDDPVGRVYTLARISAADAAAGIVTATESRAAVDILPGERELLVFARPSVHVIARAWLDDADRARPDSRLFRLVHRTIAGVDSTQAAAKDPIAREVARLLSPAGTLAVDLPKNGLLVKDESAVLDRVARRIAVLDRAPLPVTIEAAALQVAPGTPLPGFAPANDLPAAFASETNGGVMTCFASDAGDFETIVTSYTNNPDELDIAELRGRTKERVDERKPVTLGVTHGASTATVVFTPRIVPGGVDIEVRCGTAETHVRAPSGRPVAIRGFVKTDRWSGGWAPDRSELVLLVVATAELAPPPAPRETTPPPAAPREKSLELALPDDWNKTAREK